MSDTLKMPKLDLRDIFYYRKRLQNNIYNDILERFYELAMNKGLTKKDIADTLDKDAAQINRYFKEPANLTLDTISDLFLAMNSELAHSVLPLDIVKPNHVSAKPKNDPVISIEGQFDTGRRVGSAQDYA